MFIGMSFCLPIGWAFDYFQSRKKSAEKPSDTEPLLSPDQVSYATHTMRSMAETPEVCCTEGGIYGNLATISC